ncbi:DUF2357 domain-containing protein [Aeribacillus pallidus]|uniref:DUF2357 domain-containing protein n=1 Tax=Aeribacillus pallidus TaxID=33936 RepID=UPI003D1C651F
MKKELEKKIKNRFWQPVGKLDRSVMSLVLQMAPGYRDAFQIYLIVTRGLALQGKLYQMSVKDVATLYEYWTFLKLGQILGKKYKLVSQKHHQSQLHWFICQFRKKPLRDKSI